MRSRWGRARKKSSTLNKRFCRSTINRSRAAMAETAVDPSRFEVVQRSADEFGQFRWSRTGNPLGALQNDIGIFAVEPTH